MIPQIEENLDEMMMHTQRGRGVLHSLNHEGDMLYLLTEDEKDNLFQLIIRPKFQEIELQLNDQTPRVAFDTFEEAELV